MPGEQMQSYFPDWFPTIEEAKKNPKKIISDHLFYEAEVPCPENAAGLQKITIVSGNLLERDSASGFAPNGQQQHGETAEQEKERHKRLAAILDKILNEKDEDNKPQILAFQEIEANTKDDESLFNLITKKLGNKYACVRINGKPANHHGNIIFFRTGELIPIGKPYPTDETVGGYVMQLQHLKSKIIINIADVHHVFTEETKQQAQNIEDILGKDAGENTVNIVIGDLNGSIAPLDDRRRNIITGVSPAFFRIAEDDAEVIAAAKEGLEPQGAQFIDGCFFSLEQNSVRVCKQADIFPLNPETGKRYTEEELKIRPLDTFPEFQKKEILRYRVLICVDERLKQKKISNTNYTILTYEQELRKQLNDEDKIIRVRWAANLYNEKGIGIVVNEELYNYFLGLKNDNLQLRVKTDLISGQIFRVIYVSENYIPQLMKELQFFADNKKLKIAEENKNDSMQVLNKTEEIITMKREIFEAVKRGDLEWIKNYCMDENGGLNQTKFIEVIKLNAEDNVKNQRKESGLMSAAKNGHSKLVEFFILWAMTKTEATKLLEKYLLQPTEEGRTVLQEAAIIFSNEAVVDWLCQAALRLGLKNYIDAKDAMYGNTALHFAARGANFTVYQKLVEHRANLNVVANNGITPSQAIQYAADPKLALIFLSNWVKHLDEGRNYFIKNYGGIKFSEEIFNQLISIDLDLRSTENPIAQLSAFTKFISLMKDCLNPKQEENPIPYAAFLSIIWNINFNIITEQNCKTDVEQLLKPILQKAATIKLAKLPTVSADNIAIQKETDDVKILYIKTSILAQFKDLPEANKQAFSFLGSKQLYSNCPDLVLAGLKQLDFRKLDQETLAKRLVLSHIWKKINEISQRPKPTFSFLNSTFSQAMALINQFEQDLSNVFSFQELHSLIEKLSNKNEDVLNLKSNILAEFKNFNVTLIASIDQDNNNQFAKPGKSTK